MREKAGIVTVPLTLAALPVADMTAADDAHLENGETGMGKIVQFFKDCAGELKKVVWPGRDDVVSSVIVVLVSTAVVALVLGMFDWLFVAGMKILF